nr:reverse transcriptase domain-containing protein [Tanacetum cinerariifolium]
MAAEGNGDPPVVHLQTMEELCQPSLNGRGGQISPTAIQETNFGLKNDMIQQVHNSCHIHGLSGELTLHDGKETITVNLDQTSRYSANYIDMMANRIDVIDMAYEQYSQEVLGFSDGDILILEAFLNDDPSLPPLNQGYYLPQVQKELKIYESKTDKSLIDEPPKVKLKDLPPHLEYAFLEGDDKLSVIIAKDLSDKEKTALIKVLKSHKRAIT